MDIKSSSKNNNISSGKKDVKQTESSQVTPTQLQKKEPAKRDVSSQLSPPKQVKIPTPFNNPLQKEDPRIKKFTDTYGSYPLDKLQAECRSRGMKAVESRDTLISMLIQDDINKVKLV